MKKFYVMLLLVIFLFGCTMQQTKEIPGEKISKEATDISENIYISDVGEIDEELGIRSLETLEEDLGYIENI